MDSRFITDGIRYRPDQSHLAVVAEVLQQSQSQPRVTMVSLFSKTK
jgi:hypothetical protein